jgi:diguanylate cyclase (GGDEF)-like protein
MTGVELLTEIRRSHPLINGVILSGYSDSTALVQALNLGSVRGFIPKPWDINTLKAKLLETVEIFEHLVSANTGIEGQSVGINQQKLDELKNFFEFINSLDVETRVSLDLKELVKNPYSESMPDHEYLNQLQDGFALVQNEGLFTFCNPAFKRYLTITKNCQKESLTVADLKGYLPIYEALQLGLTGKGTHLESNINTKAGKSFYIEISVTPFLDKMDKNHAVIVIRDQTEKEKTISYLKGINNVAFALHKFPEFMQGLDIALRSCIDTFNVDAIALYLLDADQRSFEYQFGIGLNDRAIKFMAQKEDLSGRWKRNLADEGPNAIAILDVNKDSMPIFPDLGLYQPIKSAAFASIYEHERIIGLLAIYNQSPRVFDEDLLLLSAIGSQIGTARINAQLQEELRQQSQIDVLTGLFNRRYFFTLADRIYTRGKINKSPLAVFMLDADHFKQINDLYGHLVGDQALKAIALLVNNSIRPGDLICRYGGDEFAFLIHDANDRVAEEVSRRIQRQFDLYRLPVGDKLLQLSVSTGFVIANFNNEETLDQLLNQSDVLMYVDKNRKNHLAHEG